MLEILEKERLNTLKNMKRLQTILKVGSLPVKLEVVAKDNISPSLGKSLYAENREKKQLG